MVEEVKRLTKTITSTLENGDLNYQKFIDDIKNKLGVDTNVIDAFLYGSSDYDEGREGYHRFTKNRVLSIARNSYKQEAVLLENLRRLNSRRRTEWLLDYLEYCGYKNRAREKVNYSEISSILGITRQTLYSVNKELEKIIVIAKKIYGKDAWDVVAMIIINNKRSVWTNGIIRVSEKEEKSR